MKISAAYIRVSTDDQLEFSPDSQRKAILDYAKQHKYLLPEEFIFMEEEGRSGRKADKRPEFLRMIGTAKQKPRPFDAILVWKFSRFARNQEESIVFKSMLSKDGIEVVSISEPLIEGPFGGLVERIIEWMDEYYSIRLSGDVKRGMTERAIRGKPNAIAPFGYIMKNGELQPNPETAPVVKMIFENYLAGKTKTDIAKAVNNMGFKSTRGNKFEIRTVDYILNNPAYIGYLRWSPDGRLYRDYDNPKAILSKGSHEPIISENVWNAAKKKYNQTQALYPKEVRKIKHGEYMLHGILKCGDCGSTMTLSNGGHLRGLQCHMYSKGTCTSHYITVSKIDAAVIAQLKADVESEFFPVGIQHPRTASSVDQKAIQARLDKEAVKLKRAKEAYQAGIDTLGEYKEAKATIQQAIEKIKASITIEKEHISMADYKVKMRSVIAVVDDPLVSEESKGAALRTIVEKIEFFRDEDRQERIRIFYY